jgi:hypothetical protein
MSAQHVPNKKLEGFTNEDLQQELAVRQAILASWTGAGVPARTATAAPPATVTKEDQPRSTPATERRSGRRRKAGARKAGSATPAPKPAAAAKDAPKRRARRGISPSGKTTAQYAIEALKEAGGTRAPTFLVPLMKKAGWVTKSPDPEAVVTTTLKKASAQKKVKKVDGKNVFRSL